MLSYIESIFAVRNATSSRSDPSFLLSIINNVTPTTIFALAVPFITNIFTELYVQLRVYKTRKGTLQYNQSRLPIRSHFRKKKKKITQSFKHVSYTLKPARRSCSRWTKQRLFLTLQTFRLDVMSLMEENTINRNIIISVSNWYNITIAIFQFRSLQVSYIGLYPFSVNCTDLESCNRMWKNCLLETNERTIDPFVPKIKQHAHIEY